MLWLVRDYWESLAAFCLFGAFHSLAAREPFRNALARRTGPFFVDSLWRLIYCLISFLWYYQIIGTLHWGLHPAYDAWLVRYPDWLWQAVTAIHLGSVALIYAAFLQSDYLEFLGLRQAWRGALALLGRGAPRPPLRQFGAHRLEVSGVYGWVRHPMLIGGLIFLLTCRPTLNTLVFALMYALYMAVGSYYEERRLIQIFGQDYAAYRKRVGGFVPRLWPARPILYGSETKALRC
jgi:protein-S-isoprenylcysteine O-methyltransferase Ste14